MGSCKIKGFKNEVKMKLDQKNFTELKELAR